jgi:hypothetical protein
VPCHHMLEKLLDDYIAAADPNPAKAVRERLELAGCPDFEQSNRPRIASAVCWLIRALFPRFWG